MNIDQTSLPSPTPAQVDYARKIAQRLNEVIPWDDIQDRKSLSNWIGTHQEAFKNATYRKNASYGATSRQVAYGEKIARRKRLDIPQEYFRDAGLMSKWIDRNR